MSVTTDLNFITADSTLVYADGYFQEYYGYNIPTARPRLRRIDLRSLVFGLAGAEQAYPVYQFSSGRSFYERPRHNPFAPAVVAGIPAGAILTEGGAPLTTEGAQVLLEA